VSPTPSEPGPDGCICDWSQGMGHNLNCPIHGRGERGTTPPDAKALGLAEQCFKRERRAGRNSHDALIASYRAYAAALAGTPKEPDPWPRPTDEEFEAMARMSPSELRAHHLRDMIERLRQIVASRYPDHHRIAGADYDLGTCVSGLLHWLDDEPAARVGPPSDTPDEPYKAAMRANQMTADASYLARFLNELRELLGV